MNKTNSALKKMAITAMFAAMTTVLTYFVKIPMPGGGYIHLGDSVIYLMACFLPTPYAMIGAGIGGSLADLFGGYFEYVIPTFIIKMLIAIPFTCKSDKMLTVRNALMIVPSGLITVALYYLTKVVLLAVDKATASVGFVGSFFDGSTWVAALSNIPENTIQAAGSAVAFIIFALAFDSAKLKKRVLRVG
ncbi:MULTISPECIES: TIGR04002 family protein [unclassified Ruminococcus]|uniref:TIGR04002 family protein n=1 Tax=unclassified Ruminococcus TaxID=2608920 RepID=UPI002108C0EB|nr:MULTISPECIES: TIGR04002 family protein [unclassified Ruminococcus]MCQ4023033.1 TIGR04002 family protein [Ruminococcus sp. zg-924]MCQ4115470.1 TIGR04002 family protein [Ruminococcus sp. zg-921]